MSKEENNKKKNQHILDLMHKLISVNQAAQLLGLTRQAIYLAVRLGKLKCHKPGGKWLIHLDDLEEWKANKWSRKDSTYKGELVYDNEKSYFSVSQVAKMLGVPEQKIYYATRYGQMKAMRKGAAWVIHIDDVKAYKAKFLVRHTHDPIVDSMDVHDETYRFFGLDKSKS